MSQVFVAADYNQIEARVLAWLAGQEDILAVFARGDDVYTHDAKSVGSDNRKLGKPLRLGLGFGMGYLKFVVTAALYGVTVTEDEARVLVKVWRAANPKIVGLWYKLDDTFREAINSPAGSRLPVPGHENIVIERGKDAIGIFLPSKKRRLIYRNPRLMPNPEAFHPSKTEIVYDGVQQYSRQWGPIKTYGGKLAENITQAVARDVMAAGMLIMDENFLDLRMTVHDEVIAVSDEDDAQAALGDMLNIMREPPPWAEGLPVWAEGWTGKRYRK